MARAVEWILATAGKRTELAKRVGWAADLVSRLAGVTDHEEQHWARGSTCTLTPALHGGQIPRQKPRLPWDRSADRRRFGRRGTSSPPTLVVASEK
jgi:hypothetical protein